MTTYRSGPEDPNSITTEGMKNSDDNRFHFRLDVPLYGAYHHRTPIAQFQDNCVLFNARPARALMLFCAAKTWVAFKANVTETIS